LHEYANLFWNQVNYVVFEFISLDFFFKSKILWLKLIIID
jgi:hypothetical protein